MAAPSDEQIERLVNEASAARERAYTPYSGFKTGAAVVTESGALHTGALVENLVFGLAMCAERVALFAAVSAHAGRPTALAIAAPRTAGQRTFPCGACLQVAVEFGGPELPIIAIDPEDGSHETRTIEELAPRLPHRRDPGAGEL